MDPVTTSAIIGAGSSLVGSGINTVTGLIGRKKQWEREDNAVQRRASDLEAAGLSKTLAAGSAASSQTTPINTGSGFSDAGKALAQIPLAKAQKASMDAQKNKLQAETEAIGYNNIEAANYQQWLNTPDPRSPRWPEGTRLAGQPMFTNRDNQIDQFRATQDSERNTLGFYNKFGLPNQPGVLQSQTGQILMLNQAWSNMGPEEKREFLLAYGASTLADVAKNLLGAAGGAIGSNLKAPNQSTITHIRSGGK